MTEEEKAKRREHYAVHKIEIQRKLRDRRKNDPGYRAYRQKWDKEYRDKNKDEINKRCRERYAANPENRRRSFKKYQTSKMWKFIERNAARKEYIKQRTPKWANRKIMQEFYKQAEIISKNTGIKHHVDHIYPLKGKTGTGLNVEYNLQIIPWADNIKKRNRWPTQEEVNAIPADKRGPLANLLKDYNKK